MTEQEVNKVLFTLKAIKDHEDCVILGHTYNVLSLIPNGYEIYPDKYGHTSYVYESYFETPPKLGK